MTPNTPHDFNRNTLNNSFERERRESEREKPHRRKKAIGHLKRNSKKPERQQAEVGLRTIPF